tara:strand:- start:206 stop:367 length:162 start_codon:yes stop_codon:yes gene_type:complete
MDPVTLGFYAIVCAILGVISPGLGPTGTRLIIGAGVGLVAAAMLPLIRSSLGI